jgi:hypothetical protein
MRFNTIIYVNLTFTELGSLFSLNATFEVGTSVNLLLYDPIGLVNEVLVLLYSLFEISAGKVN